MSRKILKTNQRWCKGCGICVEFCPGEVLGINKQKIRILKPENCTACGMCEARCPDYAIWLEKEEDEFNQDGTAANISGAEV